MKSTRNEAIQQGSLRIRVSGTGDAQQFELVRYTGTGWEVASNNGDQALQRDMRAAVAGQQPGLYVPPPHIGLNGDFPRKAA